MAKGSPFSTVVFAGGGSRCLWQVGFWSIASAELNIKPSVVAGVSAGASMACVIFAGNAESTLEYFKGMTRRNRRNFYITRPLRGKPAFPHYEMYRSGILYGLDGKAMKTLRRGPEIRIMISRIPSRLGPRSATMIGILAYSVENACFNPCIRFGGGSLDSGRNGRLPTSALPLASWLTLSSPLPARRRSLRFRHGRGLRLLTGDLLIIFRYRRFRKSPDQRLCCSPGGIMKGLYPKWESVSTYNRQRKCRYRSGTTQTRRDCRRRMIWEGETRQILSGDTGPVWPAANAISVER